MGELNLDGAWVGELCCYQPEDWSHVVVVLRQSGSHLVGTMNDGFGHEHSLEGTVSSSSFGLDIGGLPGSSTCGYLTVLGLEFERDSAGRVVAFSGMVSGRCYGTVIAPYRLVRASLVRRRLQRPGS